MKTLILIILAIAVGGLWVYVNYFAVSGEDNIGGPSPTPVQADTIVVGPQRAGVTVVVGRIFADTGGYAVVYDRNDGKPGNILGYTKLTARGESLNVLVGLSRYVSSGEALFVVLHEDSGDGIFTPNIDIPIKNEYGDIIMSQFVVGR